jgi:hypothetical protein
MLNFERYFSRGLAAERATTCFNSAEKFLAKKSLRHPSRHALLRRRLKAQRGSVRQTCLN